ncbi:tetratricopeptide repeat protein [Nesterenkonia sp. MY13]|uniref:Tetratricopeptide repeat protein n=1 Tax=Nesterenkonia sedimenti TaxID=1463632 RepID=A0A7X8YF63_9MICC|nr:tetratricopeptide repeat protein [Nesterenkonia sedimenti]NLS11051.1 tetratricopeptide repeat protein [Nesterenkonia sedimenti]
MARGNRKKKAPQGLSPQLVVQKAKQQGVAAWANILGRVPGGEVKLAEWVSDSSADFMPRAEVQMTGKPRPRTRRLPVIILENYPGPEAKLADLALENNTAHPNFLERVAARAALEGDNATALRLRRRAVELDPETAHRHLALAQCLLKEPEEGVVHDWILGLAKGSAVPNSEEALQALKKAYELAPGNPVVLYEYGTALVAAGDVDKALPLLEMAVLKRPQEDWYLQLAEIYRRPDIAKFEKAMTYYERVFGDNPKNMKALSGLINAGTRGPMDWARIWRSVRRLETRKKSGTPYDDPAIQEQLDQLFWREEHPTQEQVDSLGKTLTEEFNRGRSLHRTALGLVITRLQFARHFAAGFALRAGDAQERVRALRKKPIDTPNALRNLMKAYVYLDDADTAAGLADVKFWPSGDKFESLQIEKLHADAKLWAGDAVPYIKYSKKARKRTPLTADDRMEKLIKGKRVALVGPAETGDRLGHIIDEYDVVVRPRYQPEFIEENKDAQGSRTDITYYSGQDLTSLFEGIAAAAENGDVKVVNARPFSYAAHAHRQLPWLRFYRQDFSLCFHGGSLGIQRMAYDLLQFEPEEICVFNSDLYTGNSMFTTGWRHGDTFGPYSHINDIVVSHDVKSEFKFMKALMSTGRVTAQGRAAEVLAQTPDEYVRAVEEAGVLR